jgi:hypothetical protein
VYLVGLHTYVVKLVLKFTLFGTEGTSFRISVGTLAL